MIMNGNDTAQVTFPLGAFFRQYMTAMRLTVLELSGRCPGKSFGRAAVCFNLWHFFSTCVIKSVLFTNN